MTKSSSSSSRQHLSSSASSGQLSLLPMFQTAYDDLKIEEEQLGRETTNNYRRKNSLY